MSAMFSSHHYHGGPGPDYGKHCKVIYTKLSLSSRTYHPMGTEELGDKRYRCQVHSIRSRRSALIKQQEIGATT